MILQRPQWRINKNSENKIYKHVFYNLRCLKDALCVILESFLCIMYIMNQCLNLEVYLWKKKSCMILVYRSYIHNMIKNRLKNTRLA